MSVPTRKELLIFLLPPRTEDSKVKGVCVCECVVFASFCQSEQRTLCKIPPGVMLLRKFAYIFAQRQRLKGVCVCVDSRGPLLKVFIASSIRVCMLYWANGESGEPEVPRRRRRKYNWKAFYYPMIVVLYQVSVKVTLYFWYFFVKGKSPGFAGSYRTRSIPLWMPMFSFTVMVIATY